MFCQPIIKNDVNETEKTVEKVEKAVEIQKFNEEISSTSKSHSIVTIGKIDFSDLLLKAKKEGFKLYSAQRYADFRQLPWSFKELALYAGGI